MSNTQLASFAAPSAARCLLDLAWLFRSPALLSRERQRFSASVQSFDPSTRAPLDLWLASVDAQALHAFVAQALPSKAPMRLGRYAERLMEYGLRHCSMFELIAANVQLRAPDHQTGSQTTLGEFDFLLRDAQGVHWHWELAVKFYLCHARQELAQADDFKGPAGKDTLALKLHKVFGKQLAHMPPTPYDTVVWQRAAYARGWLFYPHGAPVARCQLLNDEHLKGWWLPLSAFEHTPFESTFFVHLPRLHWLAPYQLNELPVQSQAAMAKHLQHLALQTHAVSHSAGQMIACVALCGDVWIELSRGFVLPTAADMQQLVRS